MVWCLLKQRDIFTFTLLDLLQTVLGFQNFAKIHFMLKVTVLKFLP